METAKCVMDKETGANRAIRRKPVFVVESDFRSAVVFGRMFREMGMLDDLVISVDCENALRRLHQANGDLPGLILLDREMPRMSALSFLKVLKDDAVFCMIPVVVLARSSEGEDVTACYEQGAAGYLVKSDDYADLLAKMKAMCAYWALSCSPHPQ